MVIVSFCFLEVIKLYLEKEKKRGQYPILKLLLTKPKRLAYQNLLQKLPAERFF